MNPPTTLSRRDRIKTRIARYTWIALATPFFVACGGGGGDESSPPPTPPATAGVGGIVSGLSGAGLVLTLNGGSDLAIGGSGPFAFNAALTTGAAYAVAVKTQPSTPLQTCIPTNASGTVASSQIVNVQITCTTNSYKVGGTVSGLTGTLILQNSGGNDLSVAANGTFQFTNNVASGSAYAVTVKTDPVGQTCVVTSGAGNVTNANVASVIITCTVNPAVPCGVENGTVVTHATNITANETWAGNGVVHLIPNSIEILAPATVTIQRCGIVKLKSQVQLTVRGDNASGVAKLVAAGDNEINGVVYFMNADPTPWGRLRGINKNSIIELNYTLIEGGGNVAGQQRNATIAMTGSSVLPDAVLKVNTARVTSAAGAGIYLSNARFTQDSDTLYVDNVSDYPLALPAMALGSIPRGDYVNNQHNEALVVENVNIFDNLRIRTTLPIHFKADAVHVGGLAPSFVQNVTLTLDPGVTLRFERASTSPTLVTFGDLGQSPNKTAALVVEGAINAPVTFTSAAANPQPGDWAGIWLATSYGSRLDNLIIEYAGGDANISPQSCGPFDPSINQPARHIAALFIGDNDPLQYIPPANLITNSTFRNNTGNFAIDSVWTAAAFGPALGVSNVFGPGPKFCSQSRNHRVGGCSVGGVDQSGCLVP